MDWYDAFGYLGAFLMFATFYMKTIIPLRVAGIAANLAMIVYAAAASIYPVLLLQTALLPLNVVRLVQVRRLIRRVSRASRGDVDLNLLAPFMTRERASAGQVLFRKGDPSDKLYLIQSGSVRLPEVGRKLGPGEVLGEIGILSPRHARTATAVCEEDAELLTLGEEKVLELYYQHPEFGFFLVRLVIQHLVHPAPPRPSELPA